MHQESLNILIGKQWIQKIQINIQIKLKDIVVITDNNSINASTLTKAKIK